MTFPTLNHFPKKVVNILSNHIQDSLLKWIDKSLEKITVFTNKFKIEFNNKTISNSDCILLLDSINRFFDFDWSYICEIVNRFDSLTINIVMERIKEVIYNATIYLINGDKRKEACKFDCKVFEYCSEQEKSEIKRIYSLEYLSLFLSDKFLSGEECFTISNMYQKKELMHRHFSWMMKAARKGYTAAKNDLGVCYALGKGCRVNHYAAYIWYQKAAEDGNATAYGNLAIRYYNGDTYPSKINRKKAKEYWLKAYRISKNKDYKNKLDTFFPNWMHEENEIMSFEISTPLSVVQEFYNEHVLGAQYRLALNFFYGSNGCKKDLDKARRLFLEAALYNHSMALYYLREDFEINALETTNPNEMHDIGYKYGQKRDLKSKDLSFYWYSKAIINGSISSYNNLGVCYDEGTGTTVDYKKANECYQKAMNNQNYTAYRNYAVNLFYGRGVSQDLEKSVEYLLIAKNNGIQSATDFLNENFPKSDDGKLDDILMDLEDDLDLDLDLDLDYTDDNDYSFANDNFDDVPMLTRQEIDIEFAGYYVEDKENIYLKIWVNNESDENYDIYLNGLQIDSVEFDNKIFIDTIENNTAWQSYKYKLDELDLEVYYDVEFAVLLIDEEGFSIKSKTINTRIDFSSKQLDYEI